MFRERILLLRSGRHLELALAALRAHAPGCEIAVVGTPGSDRAIQEAGVPAARTFTFAGSRFTPWAFVSSRAAMTARLWRFTRVAVLWNDPTGAGQGNVDRTALLLAPRGFLAVTPDGRVIERPGFLQARHEVRRAAASLATMAVLGALYLPAVIAPWRRSAGSSVK